MFFSANFVAKWHWDVILSIGYKSGDLNVLEKDKNPEVSRKSFKKVTQGGRHSDVPQGLLYSPSKYTCGAVGLGVSLCAQNSSTQEAVARRFWEIWHQYGL